MPKAGEVDIELGKRLRYFREQLNYSQEKLANEIGVVFQQVQKYEAGINRISCARLLKILSVLNISIIDFFAGVQVDNNILITDEERQLISVYRQKDEYIRNAILTLIK